MRLSAIHIARWVTEAAGVLTGKTVSLLHKDEMRKLISVEFAGPRAAGLYYLFIPGESLIYFQSEQRESRGRQVRTTNFLPQLIGTEVKAVTQSDFDRVIEIALEAQSKEFTLVFELFGPSSNAYLLDSQRIVITSLKDSLAGEAYRSPDQPQGMPPYELTADELIAAAGRDPERSLRSLLKDLVRGCDESFWDLSLQDVDVSLAIRDLDDPQLSAITGSILRTYERCVDGSNEVQLGDDGLSWTFTGEEGQAYREINDAMIDFAHDLSHGAAIRSLRKRIQQALRNRKRSLEARLDRLGTLKVDAEDAVRYREWAELLTINISRVKRGMTSIAVTNLYDDEQAEIAIPLRTDLSPSGNVNRLFKKYRKLVDGEAASRKQIAQIEFELEALSRYRKRLEDSVSLTDLLKLERMLVKDDILKAPRKPRSTRRRESEQRFNPRRLETSAGETILVGRNNLENEYVTFVAAKKHDLWFHSQQTPGSHVILKLKDKNKLPAHESIVEAAQVAAYFSHARTSSKVPVIYTQVRHLQKIKGGPPGKVRYTRVDSIMVEPGQPDGR